LDSIRHLTPGDFATVMRRLTLTNMRVRPETLFEGLDQEIDLKSGSKKRLVGFEI
jgi:hypothetical protein